jgi:DNA-binding winged helix-turn-helix (wHTH) protein
MLCPCCNQRIRNPAPILLSLTTNQVSVRGRTVTLSPTEADVLSVLLDAMPLPVSRERIIVRVWGATSSEHVEINVRVHICKLRRALRVCGLRIDHVKDRGWSLNDCATGRPRAMAGVNSLHALSLQKQRRAAR